MKNEKFKSFDGTTLQCYLWDDVRNPKAVVQISHGMAEHARRYDDFASFLNANGYIVFADDHRAHGMTSAKASAKGVQGYHKGNIYVKRSEPGMGTTFAIEFPLAAKVPASQFTR